MTKTGSSGFERLLKEYIRELAVKGIASALRWFNSHYQELWDRGMPLDMMIQLYLMTAAYSRQRKKKEETAKALARAARYVVRNFGEARSDPHALSELKKEFLRRLP